MARIKGWKQIHDRKVLDTGGHSLYYVTFYRNIKRPRIQIELIEDYYKNDDGQNEVIYNIGRLEPDSMSKDSMIEGDYIYSSNEKSLDIAKRRAYKYMEAYPNGV